MPLQDWMKLVSVDDHLIEHPNVWQDRLPMRYRDAGPRIVETEGGKDIWGNTFGSSEVWQWEGRLYAQVALNALAGKPKEEYGREPMRYDEIRRGCWDPVERVKDMDVDGVHAALCFPTFPRFAGTRFLEADDKDLALLCVQAYNDFVLDEWCAAAPDRLIPLVIAPLWDVDLAVAELERTAAKGARSLAFPENPVPLGLPSWHSNHWDPLFAAAQAADMPLSMHIGTSGSPPTTGDDAPFGVMLAVMPCNSISCVADLVMSPVFHRFPNLKVAISEGGIGWLPWLLERMDQVYRAHRFHAGIDRDVLPSDVFRAHVWGCFIDDENGLRNRDEIGVDQIMFEADYPHSDSLWPDSRTHLAEVLRDVPDTEAHQIAELNARRLYHFDG